MDKLSINDVQRYAKHLKQIATDASRDGTVPNRLAQYGEDAQVFAAVMNGTAAGIPTSLEGAIASIDRLEESLKSQDGSFFLSGLPLRTEIKRKLQGRKGNQILEDDEQQAFLSEMGVQHGAAFLTRLHEFVDSNEDTAKDNIDGTGWEDILFYEPPKRQKVEITDREKSFVRSFGGGIARGLKAKKTKAEARPGQIAALKAVTESGLMRVIVRWCAQTQDRHGPHRGAIAANLKPSLMLLPPKQITFDIGMDTRLGRGLYVSSAGIVTGGDGRQAWPHLEKVTADQLLDAGISGEQLHDLLLRASEAVQEAVDTDRPATTTTLIKGWV